MQSKRQLNRAAAYSLLINPLQQK